MSGKTNQNLISLLSGNNNIGDSFRKIVVVNRVVKPYMDEDGILTMGLFDFLLDAGSLERW